MDKIALERRTKSFARRMVEFVGNLPRNKVADVLGYQVLKSGTAVGSNYREANRAESRRDFIHKIGIVEKEASETQYWLELLAECHIGPITERQALLQECNELVAIFTSIGKTAKSNSAIQNLKIQIAKSAIRHRTVESRSQNSNGSNPEALVSQLEFDALQFAIRYCNPQF
jgi:four helix bundle protein